MNIKNIVSLALAAMLALPIGALAEEEMPVVTDEPLEIPMEEVADEVYPEESIAQAQSLLIDLGLLEAETADGKLGPMTVEALRVFQVQNGLEATGTLDATTEAKLDAVSRSGRSVRAVQQRLHELGYLSGAADGKFGERSTSALQQFQRLNGLNATGLLDDETLAKLFSEDARAVPAELMPGDKGEAVLALQRRLQQYGFIADEPDGAYGNKTIAAVLAFQKHLTDQGIAQVYGIVADGNATATTQFLLFSDAYSSYLRDVQQDTPDDEALRVERRLHGLGYMDLKPDQLADTYTLSALALFREKAGLAASDSIDRAVIDALFADTAPVADHCVPHDIASGDTGLAVRAVETALVSSGMTVKLPNGKYNSDVETAISRLRDYLATTGSLRAALFSDSSALSVEAQQALLAEAPGYRVDVDAGAPEAEILRVQRRLHTLFYLERNSVDGVFGNGTREALIAFQGDNRLPMTGIADKATQELLFSGDTAAKALPYRVEVSIDDQRVTVYERAEDGTYIRTHSFICSTGVGNSTPKGIFLDGFPANRWHYFEKFKCWAQYSFDIEGDIMFHSVIYSSNNEHSLRSNSLYALGSKASHGCIRLKVADAKWLFEHCSRGSLAIVIY